MKPLRLGDVALLSFFVALLLALLLRPFAPERFLGATGRVGGSEERTVTLRIGAEWSDPRLIEKARIGDRAGAFDGRQGGELLSPAPATARVRLRGSRTPGGEVSFGWVPLRPGGALEVNFPAYVLAGRIVAVEP